MFSEQSKALKILNCQSTSNSSHMENTDNSYLEKYNEESIEFNKLFTIEDIVTRNGWTYTPYKSVNFKEFVRLRYTHPNNLLPKIIVSLSKTSEVDYISGLRVRTSTSGESTNITAFPAKTAFDCYTILECGGNKEVALEWRNKKENDPNYVKEQELQKLKTLSMKHNGYLGYSGIENKELKSLYPIVDMGSVLDFESKYYPIIDLISHLSENDIAKRLTQHIAAMCDLPESTVFLVGLGIFSGMTCRKWVVEYPDGSTVPTCLYVVAEQPSGTSKTRALTAFQKPFIELLKTQRNILKRDIAFWEQCQTNEAYQIQVELMKEELARLENIMPTTNTTPEALEISLIESKGFFSAVSSEQGLFNSLLGLSYGGGKKGNNNDIILNGRDGGFVKVGRATRKSYSGNVTGNIVCFAQEGSIEKVLDASNKTGVSERFLIIAEQHKLGIRKHLEPVEPDQILFDLYSERCEFILELIKKPLEHDDLVHLTIKKEDWLKINQYRDQIEVNLKDGGDYSHSILRGNANKVTMQIMGVAANLHILNSYGNVPTMINTHHVESAINIVKSILDALYGLCAKKGYIGWIAEIMTIFNLFVYKPELYTMTEQAIKLKCRKLKPFLGYNGNIAEAIQKTLDLMVLAHILLKNDKQYSRNPVIPLYPTRVNPFI